MTIIEFHGGPITHRYLMRKTKDDLVNLYFEYYRVLSQKPPLKREELHVMFKYEIASEIMTLVRRLPVEGGE